MPPATMGAVGTGDPYRVRGNAGSHRARSSGDGNVKTQKDFVTLAYTVRRGANCGAPTPMPVPSRSS